jgi:hypothetical protein
MRSAYWLKTDAKLRLWHKNNLKENGGKSRKKMYPYISEVTKEKGRGVYIEKILINKSQNKKRKTKSK